MNYSLNHQLKNVTIFRCKEHEPYKKGWVQISKEEYLALQVFES